MDRKIEVGDVVLCRGKVIAIDDDGVPRIAFRSGQLPIRVNPASFELVEKPVKPPRGKPKQTSALSDESDGEDQ